MFKLFSLLFGRRNVAKITKGLGKMISDLDAHAEKMAFEVERTKAGVQEALSRHQRELDDLQTKINGAASERDNAAKIATNIKALLT